MTDTRMKRWTSNTRQDQPSSNLSRQDCERTAMRVHAPVDRGPRPFADWMRRARSGTDASIRVCRHIGSCVLRLWSRSTLTYWSSVRTAFNVSNAHRGGTCTIRTSRKTNRVQRVLKYIMLFAITSRTNTGGPHAELFE